MAQAGGRCTALNVSDQLQCEEKATSLNGLFCSFHSKQCQGLYRGYKTRNARLAELDQRPPTFLAESSVVLANQDFKQTESEDGLREVHDYLTERHALLDRVIRARKLHHSRFFSMNLDYGHQHYLDTLSNQKFIVLRALERLERRIAEVLYKKRRWFDWVRECQDTEEAHRENEKKKVKQEAALLKRHQKEIQMHLREMKAKEDVKRQESDLDKAYQERLDHDGNEEATAQWDPIEDVMDHDRGNFVDLIKHFLFMGESSKSTSEGHSTPAENSPTTVADTPRKATQPTESQGRRAKKAKGKSANEPTSGGVPNKSSLETPMQIRHRLIEGEKVVWGGGLHVTGTIDSPLQLKDKTASLPEEIIDQLLEDISEIKLLLFCRLLLSHAALLPAAIEANSVEEFLCNEQVTSADLRDICIKLEHPGLQEIRDACADLARGNEDDNDTAEDPSDRDSEEEDLKNLSKRLRRMGFKKRARSHMPDKWSSKSEKKAAERTTLPPGIMEEFSAPGETGNTMIDFGDLDDEGKFKSRKMRVKICGKHIYNYPSERAISRGGWLHFCVIAKNSDFHDAIRLCRHWDEFWECNVLANFHYFPAGKWLAWKGSVFRQQLLQLGFIPYFQFDGAAEATVAHQSGSRGQQYRRAHSVFEYRNFICAHVKRDDPASRRFLQYISMETRYVLVLIRDAKTGRILKQPPNPLHNAPKGEENPLWLTREKVGLGRASKNEWHNTSEVGAKFFEAIDRGRQWHFEFNDYYDICIWDLFPGQVSSRLYNTVHQTLVKAHKCCDLKDTFNLSAPILRTLTRDPVTARTRDIRPGEQVRSLWDEVERGRSFFTDSTDLEQDSLTEPNCFFREADALEENILFPDETPEGKAKGKSLYKGDRSAVDRWMKKGPDVERFIKDLSTTASDLESEDYDDEDHEICSTKSPHAMARQLEPSEDVSNPGSNIIIASRASSLYDSAISSPEFSLSIQDEEDLQAMTGWEAPISRYKDTRSDFMAFVDREKSKPFKQSWHMGDATPGAQERYQEARRTIKQMRKYNHFQRPFQHLAYLRILDVHPAKHRRIAPDMLDAHAMMSLFFSSDFFESKDGIKCKGSLLINQAERARQGPPNIRTPTSNKYMPKEIWSEYDSWQKRTDFDINKPPPEWDISIRPIIAKLYLAGVIDSAVLPRPRGQAIAAKEPGRDFDLYFDWRHEITEVMLSPEMQPSPSREQFIDSARTFSNRHPNARFAVLRIWSAPHFYPLMLGLDRRSFTSFTDLLGRAWEWKFIPKDMPYSEWSMHHTARLRLRPFEQMLGKNVVVKRDLLLVMGESEEELFKMATATTFAIQTNPWRLEIDLWKSFVNIDMEFVESLEEWLE